MCSDQQKISQVFPAKKSGGSATSKTRGSQPSAAKIASEGGQASASDKAAILLRQFDLASKYGPCTGMTRMERWQRAEDLDLNPPREVYKILKRAIQDKDAKCKENLCLWHERI